VPATIIVGAQWGDEGKGKIVDVLAERHTLVARYQGGSNAGHTVLVGAEEFKFHLLPSGILSPETVCILGAGVVIDPEVLVRELDELEGRGRPTNGLRISGNAHLVLPWHRLIDQATEVRLGDLQIGTTRRGIGPAYADRAARVGIRVQDLLDRKILREKIIAALSVKKDTLQHVFGVADLDAESIIAQTVAYADRLEPHVADTSLLIAQALARGESLLCEGAQGTLLDLDHGTYPFVTSSNPIAGGACVGLGFGPTHVTSVVGVAKAYLTRVGAGPFPSEADPDDDSALRVKGGEFGTTTGRARRCGWLDLVGLRFAARVNGLTELVLTKLDVLSGFDHVRVCTAYRLPGGRVVDEFPAHQSDFHHASPVFETLEGWQEPLDDVTRVEDLPAAARAYVAYVAGASGVPVSLVGVGQRRDQVLVADAATTCGALVA